ncbi:MAG: hypothetical protein HZB46_13380 [Solirubrobacterales bacterium]|nr:hypothetical protein [Solirubrobacterales bacterium]
MTTATEPARPATHPVAEDNGRRGLWVALLGVAAVATFALLMYQGRGRTFFYDEWDFVTLRSSGGLDTLLERHNEHIAVLPAAVYRVLLETIGLAPVWPYRALAALAHVGCAVLVFSLARRRVGDAGALVAAVLLLGLGAAWQDTLWGFQIGFLGSIFFGLLAFEALDRGGPRADLLACAALLLATLSSSLGVPFAAGIGAELLWRRRWGALWVPAVAVVVYGAWYLGYGQSAIEGEGLSRATQWAVDAAAASAGALFGRGLDWGRPLLAVGAALAAVAIVRRGVSPRLVGVLVLGAAFWLLTGAARSGGGVVEPPDTSRYLELGAVVLLLAGAEIARGSLLRPAAYGVAAVVVAISLAQGLQTLGDGGGGLRDSSNRTYARLAAAEIVQQRLPAGYHPLPADAPGLTAGRYVNALKNVGESPVGDPVKRLEDLAPAYRTQGDKVLAEVGLAVSPAGRPAGTAPALEGTEGAAKAQAAGACQKVTVPGGGAVVLTLPRGGVVVRGGAGALFVHVRRFAPAFDTAADKELNPGEAVRVAPTPDKAPAIPYHLRLASTAPFQVCAA